MKNIFIRVFILSLFISPGFANISMAKDITVVNLSSAYTSHHLFEQTIFTNPQQQYILGSIYENGDGVLINEPIALMWYIISDENGYSNAQGNIHKLEKYMANDQILKAKNLAQNWLKINSH